MSKLEMEGIDIKPLLAHIYEPHRVTYPCYIQPKLNGIRALYQNGHFQSRDRLPFPPGLLEHLAAPLRKIFDERVILDGELYVHGWPLQRINAAVTPVRQEPTEDTRLVEYHVFDVVNFNSSFENRYWAGLGLTLLELKAQGSRIQPVYTSICMTEVEANKFYALFVSQKYEGMMYRLGDCPYTVPRQTQALGYTPPNPRSRHWSDKDNRCWHLLKRKDWQDDEFICVGVEEGEGRLKGMVGALQCRLKSLGAGGKDSFTVGSGLTDAQRIEYWANPPIGRLIKVKYLVLSNDGIPLNPTILAIL